MKYNSFFIGEKPKQPIRLEKQTSKNIEEILNDWISKNFYIIVLATFVLIWIILTLILFTICHSSVDSGIYYHHLEKVI